MMNGQSASFSFFDRCTGDITFGHALQLIFEIMLQMIQERYELSGAQLDQFLADFIGYLPISYQHTLLLKVS